MALVFARQMTPDLASLVKAIDEKAAATDGKSSAFIVFLPADEKAIRSSLETQAAKDKISIPLTLAVDAVEAAKQFKLTPGDKMPVNVILYRDKTVKKTFNFSEVKADDVKTVVAAYEEIGK